MGTLNQSNQILVHVFEPTVDVEKVSPSSFNVAVNTFGTLSSSYALTSSYAVTASTSQHYVGFVFNITTNPANTLLTNIPSAITEWDTLNRVILDMRTYNKIRMISEISNIGDTASIALQYSTDLTNWNYINVSNGPILTPTTTGMTTSSWDAISPNAKVDAYVRWVTLNGSGSGSISFRKLMVGLA